MSHNFSIRLAKYEKESLRRQAKEKDVTIADFVKEKIWKEWAEMVIKQAPWKRIRKFSSTLKLLEEAK